MVENSRVRGLYTLAKWTDNTSPTSSNRLVTRTLGKYGFVSSDYDGPSPRHDEFWLVRIDREIQANSLKGCFVLTPVKPVERKDIGLLVSGLGQYTEFYEDGIRYVIPADKDKYYIMPLAHRKGIKDVRSVIVVNFMLARFNNSDRYFHFPSEAGYEEEQGQYKNEQHGSSIPSLSSHEYKSSTLTFEKPALSQHQRTPYDG